MITSTRASTSSPSCGCTHCGHGCHSKEKVAAVPRKLGFLARSPWLFVVAAFLLMFTAWTIMFSMAALHPVASVPLVSSEDR